MRYRGSVARMQRAIVLFACAAAAACTEIDLDSLNFACEREGRCRDASSAGDRGEGVDSGDASSPEDDAGVDGGAPNIEGRCSPSVEESTPETRYWWCRNMTASALRGVTERFGAKILDIEAEDPIRGTLFTAALERKQTGFVADWAEDISRGDVTAFNQNNLELVDVAALELAGDRIRFAASFEYLPGSRYWDDNAAAENISDAVFQTLDDDGWRLPNYGPRVVDLSRWFDGTTERFMWLAKVRGTQRISEIVLDRTREQVDALSATKKILDLERTAFNDRFTVVTATRAPTDPEMHFVYAAPVDELDRALSDHSAHVWRIAPHRFGSAQRWSAVIVRTSTSAKTRVLERLGDHSAGEGAVVFAGGEATLSETRAHAPWRAGQFAVAMIALYTFQQLEAQAISFNDAIPNYPVRLPATCPPSQASGTATVREALLGMLARWEPDKTKALVSYFGERAIESWATSLGFDVPRLTGTLGCTSHATDTTLADGVRIFREMARLSPTLRAELYAMMLGPNPDPASEGDIKLWNYATVFPELVKEEADRLQLPAALRDHFAAQITFRYARGSRATTSTLHDAGFLISAEIPRCEDGLLTQDTFIYGAALTGASTTRDSNRALGLSRAELFREKIRESLATFDCAP